MRNFVRYARGVCTFALHSVRSSASFACSSVALLQFRVSVSMLQLYVAWMTSIRNTTHEPRPCESCTHYWLNTSHLGYMQQTKRTQILCAPVIRKHRMLYIQKYPNLYKCKYIYISLSQTERKYYSAVMLMGWLCASLYLLFSSLDAHIRRQTGQCEAASLF